MPLKVIGAGLGRTGTASVKVALEQLGVGRCYHMSEVVKAPGRIQDWIDAADGNPDWDTWFDSTNATIMSQEFRAFMAHSPFGTMTRKTIYDTLDCTPRDRSRQPGWKQPHSTMAW